MALHVVPVHYGAPALEALADAVAEAKGDEPLQPVTVVVPSNYAGVAARRALARRTGLAAVGFVTVYRLAELLAGPTLATQGRVPLSSPVLTTALRAVLADHGGIFRSVAGQPATVEALRRVHRELRELDDEQLAALGRTDARADAVVAIDRRVTDQLRGRWFDETDLTLAAQRLVHGGGAASLGPVVVHLPQRLTASAAALLLSLAGVGPVTVILGLTDEPSADRGAGRVLRHLGIDEVPRPPPTVRTATVERIVATDPDDEVRTALRRVVAAAADGTPLERIVIGYPPGTPYGRLLTDHLAAAGLPWNGVASAPLAERVAGRACSASSTSTPPRCPATTCSRCCVSLPAKPDRPVAVWERHSRRAGVVAGAAQWQDRLALDAAERREPGGRCRSRTARRPRPARQGRGRRRGRVARAPSWPSWRTASARRPTPPGRPTPAGLAACVELVGAESGTAVLEPPTSSGRPTGSEAVSTGWPSSTPSTAAAVDAAVFRAAVEAELQDGVTHRRPPRRGPLRRAAAPGRRHRRRPGDRARHGRGRVAGRRSDDPLLSDRSRRALGGALATTQERRDALHHQLLALADAACEHRRRQPAPLGPAHWRWSLPVALARHGRRPWGSGRGARARFLPGRPPRPAATGQRAGGARCETSRRSCPPVTPPRSTSPPPRTPRSTPRSASSGPATATGFTEFDGNLAALTASGVELLVGDVFSPTALEAWTACPFAYFLRHVLGLREVENPEDELSMRPTDRGYVDPPGAGGRRRGGHRRRDGAEARGALARRRPPPAGHQLRRALCGRGGSRSRRPGTPLAVRAAPPAAAARGLRGVRLRGAGPVRRPAPRHGAQLRTGPAVRRDPSERPDAEAGRQGRPGRHVVRRASSSSTTRPPAPPPRGTRIRSPVRSGCSSRSTGWRPGATSGGPDAEVVGEYWHLHRERERDVGAASCPSTRPRSGGCRVVLEVITDGIDGGLFVQRPDPPDPWRPWIGCAACDPDGAGTATRLVAMAAQAGRPGAAGLRRSSSSPIERPPNPIRRHREHRRRCSRRRRRPTPHPHGPRHHPLRLRRRWVRQDHRARRAAWSPSSRRGTPVDHIAAITFTEKAADELRDRIRTELARHAEHDADPASRRRCATALDDLDQAAFCTLHSFAQRVLTAFPVEAGLPPAITVLDEISSDAGLRRSLAGLLRRARRPPGAGSHDDAGPGARGHAPSTCGRWRSSWTTAGTGCGCPTRHGPSPRRSMSARWSPRAQDLLDACAPGRPRPMPLAAVLVPWLPRLARGGAGRLTTSWPCSTSCSTPGWGRWATAARGPPGRGPPSAMPKSARDAAKGLVDAETTPTVPWPASSATLVGPHPRPAQRRARPVHARPGRAPASSRAAHLPRPARALPPSRRGPARTALASGASWPQRYEALLVDEYQDTDPLQLDIVLAIATPPGEDRPRPGQLFFVGDPKQSLYRFRRADINLFLRTPERIDADEVSLTTNFRSTPPILGWVNHVFDRLIVHRPRPTTARRWPNLATRPSTPRPAPPVAGPAGRGARGRAAPAGHPRGRAARATRRQDVAAAIRAIQRARAGRSGSPGGGDAATATARLARHRDPLPARTMLGQLETALARRRHPVPARHRLAGLRRRRDPGPAPRPCAPSPTRPTTWPSSACCAARCTAAATSSCTGGAASAAVTGTPRRRGPSAADGDDTIWDAMADLRERHRQPGLAHAQRAARVPGP